MLRWQAFLLCCVVVVATMLRPSTAATPTVDHIVILRFCLTHPNKPFPTDYCNQLLDMFEATAWRSLLLQDANFRILALYAPDMPQDMLNRLKEFLRPFNTGMYTVRNFIEPGYMGGPMDDAVAGLQDFAAKVPAAIRITTRHDVDDCLHVNTFRHIQEFAEFPGPLMFNVVNQQRGWAMRFVTGDDGVEMACMLAPFHFPFNAQGQSFINRRHGDNTSILNFEHTNGGFTKQLQSHFALNLSDISLKYLEATFLHLPLARGYVHVRHQLVNSGNFMEVPPDSVPCASMLGMLHKDFGIREADINTITALSKVAVAIRAARDKKADL